MADIEEWNKKFKELSKEEFEKWNNEQKAIEKAEQNYLNQQMIEKKDQLRWAFNDFKNICLNDKGEHIAITTKDIINILKSYNLTQDEFNNYDPIKDFILERTCGTWAKK